MWSLLLACRADPEISRPDPTGTPTLTFTEEERPRNLLFVSFDTLRRDHMDAWSTDGVARSPFLSSVMTRGLTLDAHVQCSNWTYASTSCTLRGQLMEETGFYPKISSSTREPLPDGQPSIARRLADRGYRTALVSSNGWLSSEWNNAQGYEQDEEFGSGDAGAITGEGLSWMRAYDATGAPWFVHVHLIEPHPAYLLHEGYTDEIDALPPLPFSIDTQDEHYVYTRDQWPDLDAATKDLLKRHLEARYSAEIRYMDDRFREFWEEATADGLLDDTLVVFWNDHGEQFWEHGHQSHAWNLNAEENDTFAAFVGPGIAPQRWTAPTHSVDVVPTALDALGFDPTGDPDLPGYVVGTAPAGRARFSASVARIGPTVSVIRDDGWRMTVDLDDGEAHVWDRATDPGEQRDRFDPDDPRTQALWDLLEPRMELLRPLVPESSLERPRGLR